jgi:adenosylhomocysteine nucleosidase
LKEAAAPFRKNRGGKQMKSEVQNGKKEIGTLVCFALNEEFAPFRKLAGQIPDIAVLITGVGRANAEASVRRFLAKNLPKLVLTCGFAGGLNPALKNGDVVFMTGYSALEERLANADAVRASFFTSPRIATTVAEKKQLWEKTGADVVEMESGAILAVCRESRIPCAMVRAISDTASEDLPLDFNRLSKPDMSLDYGKLALAITKAPWKIFALVQLHKKTSFAAKQLADVLAKVIW